LSWPLRAEFEISFSVLFHFALGKKRIHFFHLQSFFTVFLGRSLTLFLLAHKQSSAANKALHQRKGYRCKFLTVGLYGIPEQTFGWKRNE
jgi:hypothetical protein